MSTTVHGPKDVQAIKFDWICKDYTRFYHPLSQTVSPSKQKADWKHIQSAKA